MSRWRRRRRQWTRHARPVIGRLLRRFTFFFRPLNTQSSAAHRSCGSSCSAYLLRAGKQVVHTASAACKLLYLHTHYSAPPRCGYRRAPASAVWLYWLLFIAAPVSRCRPRVVRHRPVNPSRTRQFVVPSYNTCRTQEQFVNIVFPNSLIYQISVLLPFNCRSSRVYVLFFYVYTHKRFE